MAQPLPPALTKNLILAADGHLAPLVSEADHIWEFQLNGSESSPFSLQTNYGLQARSMRLFPGFLNGPKRMTELEDHPSPWQVLTYCPTLIRGLGFPFPDAEVRFDILMSQSDLLGGRITLTNAGKAALSLTITLNAILNPMGQGHPTRTDREGINQIITGQTGTIHPVLFMTGGPDAISTPSPALSLPMKLKPGQQRQITWALASCTTRADSLEMARQLTAASWEKAITARILSQEKNLLRIHTGRPEWDAVFQLAQTCAHHHLIAESAPSDKVRVRRSRLPDDTPPTEDSSSRQNDITVLEAYHLVQVLLPGEAHRLADIVQGFLDSQMENGQVPSRLSPPTLGLAFQELPLLAQLCLEIFETTRDKAFLKNAFPGLLRFWLSWFDAEQLPEETPIPVLQWPEQLQMDTGLYAFDIWKETGRGLDIRTVKAPALLALLHREAAALIRITEIGNLPESREEIFRKSDLLASHLQDLWSPEKIRFAYQDKDSGLTPSGMLLYTGTVREHLEINRHFETPQRLHITLTAADARTRVSTLVLEGLDRHGNPVEEQVKPRGIRWVAGRAFHTTRDLFQAITRITTSGLTPTDHIRLEIPDLTDGDLTCLLPIWSGQASPDQRQAVCREHLDPEGPLMRFGVPEILKPENTLPDGLPVRVNLLWNACILNALERADQGERAAVLFEHTMEAVLRGLRDFNGFYPAYDADTGRPAGKRNLIAGLPPLRLFLQLAGIRVLSPQRVAIWGTSPFPWPVEVHWRGLMIRREKTETTIRFPNGEILTTASEESRLISQKETRTHEDQGT